MTQIVIEIMHRNSIISGDLSSYSTSVINLMNKVHNDVIYVVTLKSNGVQKGSRSLHGMDTFFTILILINHFF